MYRYSVKFVLDYINITVVTSNVEYISLSVLLSPPILLASFTLVIINIITVIVAHSVANLCTSYGYCDNLASDVRPPLKGDIWPSNDATARCYCS